MRRGVEFLVGLLASDAPGLVAAEDAAGPHAAAVRAWQGLGFIGREPGVLTSPGCPHCDGGVPYRVGDRWLCAGCRSRVGEADILAWPLDRIAVAATLAAHLHLQGGVRAGGSDLWQLGTGRVADGVVECFALFGGDVPGDAARHLTRYVRAVVLHGPAADAEGRPGRWVPLAELFADDGSLAPTGLAAVMSVRGRARYDAGTGGLFVGGTRAGEVPVGSREAAFLEVLAGQTDRFVAYADLKREVLRRTRGSGGTEEATFCQKLKSRIKGKYIPGIDRLVVTSNKGDGYRLRAEGGL